MANELNLALGQTGQAITARLIAAGAYVGTSISLSESPASSGFYTGSVPGGTAAGSYDVLFLSGSSTVGSGRLFWDGSAEVGLLELASRNWSNAVVATRALAGAQSFNLTGNITGNLSGSVGNVTGAVSVGSISAGAVTASAIAADAITAAKLAGDVTTEIQSGLLEAANYIAPDNTGISTLLTRLSSTRAGYLDNLSAGAVALQSTVSALPSASTIATQVWGTATSGLIGVGSVGKLLSDQLDAAISSRLAAAAYTVPPTAAVNASAVRVELTPELDRIDATVSSRFAAAGYTAPNNTSIGEIAAAIPQLATSAGLEALQVHGDATWATTDATAANQQLILTAVQAIPTNTLLANAYTPPNNDAIAAINQRLPLQPAAKEDVQVSVLPTPITVEPTPVVVTGQFEEGDRNLIKTLKNLAEADERVTPTRYQKLVVGTATVLLDKNVTNDGAGNISLVQRL